MARKQRKSFITTFTDFHNMKLLPKNEPKKPKKYHASAMPRKRLLAYFENYAPQILKCQSAEKYKYK